MSKNIKKFLIELYDTIIWTMLFLSIGILILYLGLPVVSYYLNTYKVKSLSKDMNLIGKKWDNNFKDIGLKYNNKMGDVKIINTNEISTVKNEIEKMDKDNDKNNMSGRMRKIRLLVKKINENKNKKRSSKIIDSQKNVKDIKSNKDSFINKFPLKDFIYNSKKIYINGESSNIIYKDIKQNIQRDLWKNSVISDFYGTPIIFTHSSGGKYNFGLYYLNLKNGSYIYLKGNYNGINYYIEGKVIDIYKNIPGNNLYNKLVDIWHQYNYKENKVFYLDTCELNWTKRRVTVVKIKNIYIK